MIFKKNELINETLDKHFETWSHTLNTSDFVSQKYLNKIDKIIFNNLNKKLKEIEIYNLLYLEERGYKLNIFQKLAIWFSGLSPLYKSEKNLKEHKPIQNGTKKPKHNDKENKEN